MPSSYQLARNPGMGGLPDHDEPCGILTVQHCLLLLSLMRVLSSNACAKDHYRFLTCWAQYKPAGQV